MGFFDEYVDEGGDGSEYLDKDALIKDKTVLTVKSVAFQPGLGYAGADRYLLIVDADGIEDGKVTFGAGSVDKRDRMLANMATYLGNGGEPVRVVLAEGRSTGGNKPPQFINNAE